jgi:hypothetical protein
VHRAHNYKISHLLLDCGRDLGAALILQLLEGTHAAVHVLLGGAVVLLNQLRVQRQEGVVQPRLVPLQPDYSKMQTTPQQDRTKSTEQHRTTHFGAHGPEMES